MPAWLDANPDLLVRAGLVIAIFGALDGWLRYRHAPAKLGRAGWGIAVALLVVGEYFAHDAAQRDHRRTRLSLETAAQIYAQELARLGHARIGLSAVPEDPGYLELIEAQKRWKRAFPELGDLRTYRRVQGKVRIVVAAETDRDRNGKFEGTREQRVPIGREYSFANPALSRALEGNSAFLEEPVTDDWGEWVGPHVPLRDAQGRTEAALGVNYPSAQWRADGVAARSRVHALMNVPLLLLAVGSFLFARQRALVEKQRESDARIQAALSGAPFDLWLTDDLGQLLPIGDGVPRIPLAKTAADFAEANRRALSGELVRDELVLDQEGRRHWQRLVAPVRVGSKIVGAVGAQFDITARAEADEARRKSEEKLALHVRHTPLAVIEWNLAFRVTAWNPAAERLFGYTANEAIGRHAVGFIVPESARSQVNRVWTALLAHKGGTRSTNENITKDGRSIHCEWYNTPLVDDTGAVIGVATSVQDETEREILEKQLHQAQKMESIGQLAGGVAHEFNNLLTPMLMQTELVAHQYADDPRLMSLLRPVQHAIQQAAELNRRILAVGRRNAEQRESLLLNPLVENALALLRPSLDRRIEFTVTLADGLEPLLLDRAYITQIVMNLALNARDTLLEKLERDPRPGWIPRLSVTTERVKDAVRRDGASATPFTLAVQRLTVTDNGLGITPETRARIFEPFFTTKPAGSGTGLGLAVVWNVVHSLNGWIEVGHGPGAEGTRFQISLPIPSNLAVVPGSRASPIIPSWPVGKFGPKSSRPLKILLAEDNSLVAETFSAVLSTGGHDVLVVQDGEEAWELFNRLGAKFDVVLADFNMPRINGGELLRRVKAVGFTGRVVIVSGYLTSEKVDELLDAGADGVLRKPFSPAELFGVLEAKKEKL